MEGTKRLLPRGDRPALSVVGLPAPRVTALSAVSSAACSVPTGCLACPGALGRGAHGRAPSWCWAWGAEERAPCRALCLPSFPVIPSKLREVFLSCESLYLLVVLSRRFQVFSCMC